MRWLLRLLGSIFGADRSDAGEAADDRQAVRESSASTRDDRNSSKQVQAGASKAFRITIRPRRQFGDPHAEGVLAQIRELGIAAVESVRSARLFFVYGQLTADQANRVARELLVDPVVEESDCQASAVSTGKADANKSSAQGSIIEVHLKPGVMDPVADSTIQAIKDMGLPVTEVRTARRYELDGQLARTDLDAIARSLLANPVIEDVHFADHTPPEVHGHEYKFKIIEVPIRQLGDAALEKLSKDGDLFLNLTEMKAVQEYFRKLGREPRDVELEMIAQTWSEHCVHKTFRSDVRVRDEKGQLIEEIPNLIKSTVFAATEKLARPWCISVFKDNAGVIEFDDKYAVCFKVETHNHPSAIEPYGGASTGIGGVIRDPMGTGLGAKPVANTDIFCFGPPDVPPADVPRGVLHPRRVMRGVVAGVRDYGNRMGIPTVNGAVYFDPNYMGNPLVFCGTVGLLPKDKCFKEPRTGDAVIVVGGRTGRDGIHGATFSSGELTHEHQTEFSHAVQIGNAITEKKTLDTIIQARDAGLFSAITDCGAGGLSSAVGEMGEKLGAEIHLDRVPLKYAGLSYSEIWISEAQERMVLSVPPANVDRILKVFADEGVEAVVIGTFGTSDKKLRLFYAGQGVGELGMDFLHEGLPRPTKDAVLVRRYRPSPSPRQQDKYNDALLKILASPNVASKEWIIRQYDHEVQGGSAVKPLVGVGQDSPGDAAVVRPVLGSSRAVVIACGMNPQLGELDPYQSALHAVDEALRNCVAVGGNMDRTAILDNFCWGNCNKPDRMAGLVQAAKACYDAAIAYGTPFISGKDSLNNEFRTDSGQTIAIPPTLLISAISVIDDAGKCVTADAKEAGNYIFILGRTQGLMGGSHYLLAEGLQSGTDVPPVDSAVNLRVMRAIQSAIQAGLVRACHDLSEGGLAVAAAEMAFAGGLGMELDLAAVPIDGSLTVPKTLFSESAGRFLIEVAPRNYDAFLRLVRDCPFGELGRINDSGNLAVRADGKNIIDLPLADAKAAWQKTFATW
ncbi:MAG: phosphoribosylformylglycinamidine synthase subunit PurL [Planctomycetes bacterium]|nr:phosphoribosylformylglycinamidine synthase subunit PurL [Planctomycetota bacterium]